MFASAQQQNVWHWEFRRLHTKPKSDRDYESINRFIIMKRNKHLLFLGAYNKVIVAGKWQERLDVRMADSCFGSIGLESRRAMPHHNGNGNISIQASARQQQFFDSIQILITEFSSLPP